MWWDLSWGGKCVRGSTIKPPSIVQTPLSLITIEEWTQAYFPGSPSDLCADFANSANFKRAAHFSTLLRAKQLPGWRAFSRSTDEVNKMLRFIPPHNYCVKNYSKWVKNVSPPVREGVCVLTSHSKTDVLLVGWRGNVRITAKDKIWTVTLWFVASGDVKHRNICYSLLSMFLGAIDQDLLFSIMSQLRDIRP